MLKEELIVSEINKYADILRILETDKNWRIEADNQLRKIRAKLGALGVSVEPLTIEAVHSGT